MSGLLEKKEPTPGRFAQILTYNCCGGLLFQQGTYFRSSIQASSTPKGVH